MARYEISNEVRPLDRLITGFASSCGYEIQTVFNDLLRFIIHGFSPGAPPISNWKYKRQQNASFMDTYHAETNRQVGLVRRFR
jgi:type I restriction enzyme M protein